MIGNQAGSGSAFPDLSLIILPQMLNILTRWATPRSQNVANTFPPLCLAQGVISSQHPQLQPISSCESGSQKPFFLPMPSVLSATGCDL